MRDKDKLFFQITWEHESFIRTCLESARSKMFKTRENPRWLSTHVALTRKWQRWRWFLAVSIKLRSETLTERPHYYGWTARRTSLISLWVATTNSRWLTRIFTRYNSQFQMNLRDRRNIKRDEYQSTMDKILFE